LSALLLIIGFDGVLINVERFRARHTGLAV